MVKTSNDHINQLIAKEDYTTALYELAKIIASPSSSFKDVSVHYSLMQSICRSHLNIDDEYKKLVKRFKQSVGDAAKELCLLTVYLDPRYPHETISDIEEKVLKRIEKLREVFQENDRIVALSYLLQSNAYLSMNDIDQDDEEEQDDDNSKEDAPQKSADNEKEEEEEEEEVDDDEEYEDDEDDDDDDEALLTEHQEQADKALDVGISKYPNFSLLYRNKASLYNIAGMDNEIALEHILKAKELCEEPSLYYTEGMIREDLGMHKEAISLFNKCLESEPNDAHTYFNIANSYENMGETEKALEYYDKSIQNKSDHSDAYASKARLYAVNGNTELALTNFNKAIESDPENAEFVFERAILYRDLIKDQDAALKDFEKALELDADDESIQLGLIAQEKLIMCNKDIAESEADDWSVYLSRGQLYLEMLTKPSLAVEDFNTALNMPTGSTQSIIYLNRGYAHIELGEFDKAQEDMQKAIELDKTEGQIYAEKAKEASDELQQALRTISQ